MLLSRLLWDLVDEIHIKDDITLKTSQEIYDLFTMTPYYYKTKYEMQTFELNKNKLITCDFLILLYQKQN